MMDVIILDRFDKAIFYLEKVLFITIKVFLVTIFGVTLSNTLIFRTFLFIDQRQEWVSVRRELVLTYIFHF